jgi:ferredoxin
MVTRPEMNDVREQVRLSARPANPGTRLSALRKKLTRRARPETAAIVLGALVIASVLVQNFWCRYLCPYGALLGLTSLLSPLRIRRSEPACIDCAKCAKACPSALPVDKLVTINSAECTGCLECVAVCPAEGALQLALGPWTRSPNHGRLPAWAMAAGIAVLFFGIIGYAKTAGYWNGDVPNYIYRQLVPRV